MKKSMYDLAFDFIEKFYGHQPCPDGIKKDILGFMGDLLYDGFKAEEIIQRWENFSASSPNKMPKLNSLYAKGPTDRNLLMPHIFYYHNLLQVTPGAPVRDIDLNTGKITKIDEPYFLEMRASLSLDQMVDYYAGQMGSRISGDSERRKHAGTFRWLMKNHDVESILFMIDVASNLAYAEDMGVIEPVKLGDYKIQAIAAKMAKITEIRQAGDERIVPKQRILSSRRRREDQERLHPQSGYATI